MSTYRSLSGECACDPSRLAALEAVAEAARRWRENARPAVAVVKAATFDDVQAMSEKAARFGDALAAALDALEDQQ